MILKPVDLSGRRSTPRKCSRIFFVRGQIQGCNNSVSCGKNELSETQQVRSSEEAHGRARGKRSAWSSNQQSSLNSLGNESTYRIGIYFTELFYTLQIGKSNLFHFNHESLL
jgi:hypothetical protein